MEQEVKIVPTQEEPNEQKPDVESAQQIETALRTLTAQIEAGALNELTGVQQTYERAHQIAGNELPEDASAETRAGHARLREALDRFNAVLAALKQPAGAPDGSEPIVVRDGNLMFEADAEPAPVRKNRLESSDAGPAEGTLGVDDEDVYVAKAAEVDTVTATTEVEIDPFAERNAASDSIIAKLTEGNYAAGSNMDMARVTEIKDAIVNHVGETLAARFDTDGNLVIGVPQLEGSYLRSRLITIDAKTDAAIVDWVRQSLSEETQLLREPRYTVPVEKPEQPA